MSQPFPITENVSPPPFENLVLEGGGVKGIAYVGALKTLEKKGELASIKRVGGSSAGGITAMLLALGYTPDEIKLEMESIEFNLLLDSRSKFWSKYPKWMDTKHQSIRKALFKTGAFLLAFRKEKVGIYEGEIFLQWARAKITAKLGNPNATFADLKEAMNLDPSLGFKELMLTATNISGPGGDILRCFDAETAGSVKIADALRATMSFPGAFDTYDITVNGVKASYVDGGLTNNFPMEYYDDKKFMPENGSLNDIGVNPYTLGLRVDNKEEIENYKYGPITPPIQQDANPVHSWLGFARGIWNAIRSDRDKVHHKYYANTIQIFDNDVSTLDFDLSETAKHGLIKEGELAVDSWHRLYRKGVKGLASKSYIPSDEELIKIYNDYEKQLKEPKLSKEKSAYLIRKKEAIKALRPQLFNKTSKEKALEAINQLVDTHIDYAHSNHAFLYATYIKLENLIELGRNALNKQNTALAMLNSFPKSSDIHQLMIRTFEEVEKLQASLNEKIANHDKNIKDANAKEESEPKEMFSAKLMIEFQFEKTHIIETLRKKLIEENTLSPKDQKFLLKLLSVQLDKAHQGKLYLRAPHETYYEKCLSMLAIEGKVFENKIQELGVKEKKCAEELKSQRKKIDALYHKRLKNGDDFNAMFQLSNQLKTFISDQDSFFLTAQKGLRGALQVCTLYLPIKFLATRLFKVNAKGFERFENRFITNQALYRNNAKVLESNLAECLNNWKLDCPQDNAQKYIKFLKSAKDNIEAVTELSFKFGNKANAAKNELLTMVDKELSDFQMREQFQEMIDKLAVDSTLIKKSNVDKYIDIIKSKKKEIHQELIKQFPSVEQRKGGRIDRLLLPFTRKLEELERLKSVKANHSLMRKR